MSKDASDKNLSPIELRIVVATNSSRGQFRVIASHKGEDIGWASFYIKGQYFCFDEFPGWPGNLVLLGEEYDEVFDCLFASYLTSAIEVSPDFRLRGVASMMIKHASRYSERQLNTNDFHVVSDDGIKFISAFLSSAA